MILGDRPFKTPSNNIVYWNINYPIPSGYEPATDYEVEQFLMSKIRRIPKTIGEMLKESRVTELNKEIAEHLADPDELYAKPSNKPEVNGANSYQTGGTHYKDMAVQPWSVIDTWPLEQQVGYYRGNCLKYTLRMGSKDERLKEAKKIAHYAAKLVEVLEKTGEQSV